MPELRSERPPDIPGIRAVLLAAFDTPLEAGLVDTLRTGDAWLPDGSVVAVEDGRVIAHALLSRIHIGEVPALALGPVAVLPSVQNRGHGSAVVRAALAGFPHVPVIVLGEPAYYRRFGFEPGAPHGVTGPWSSAGDAWQVLNPVAGEAVYPQPWHDL